MVCIDVLVLQTWCQWKTSYKPEEVSLESVRTELEASHKAEVRGGTWKKKGRRAQVRQTGGDKAIPTTHM